jgi:hypothetical protein
MRAMILMIMIMRRIVQHTTRRGRGFLFLSFSRVFLLSSVFLSFSSRFPLVFSLFSHSFLIVLNYKKNRENYEKAKRPLGENPGSQNPSYKAANSKEVCGLVHGCLV